MLARHPASITPRIVRVPILPFGTVNSHLVIGAEGCVLVDAGLPGSEARILRTLKQHALGVRDIRLIVVTHAHVDHAGSAALLRRLSGAPIVAHENDAPHYSRAVPMSFCPTGWFGRLFLKTPLMRAPYEGFAPDILLSKADTLDLRSYGLRGIVRHTPGHTAGSISVELATKEALVGDLLASGILLGGLLRTSHAMRPPFEDDPRAVGVALRRLLDSGMERFHMGHGGPLDAQEVGRHGRALLTMQPW